MSGKIYRFSYYVPPDGDRDLRLHEIRDGSAFAELAAVLYAQNYVYGDLLLNYPANGKRERNVDQLLPVMTSSDLLVLTTRPPLNDDEAEDRKTVRRSGTSLEKRIFEILSQYFDICSRNQVVISNNIANQLNEQNTNKAAFKFNIYGSATYFEHSNYKRTRWYKAPSKDRTVVYLLYTRKTWKDGPGLLATFGLGGPENLVWANLLRTKLPHLVASPRFFMAEMKMSKIPDRPPSLAFAARWELIPLINLPIP